jgi:hypothetical protein
MLTTVGEIDYSLWLEKTTEPTMDTPMYDHKWMHYSMYKVKWKRSNTKCMMLSREA